MTASRPKYLDVNNTTTREIYTIGHSNHSIDRFIELLTLHAVRAAADVRSHPYSRFNPQFRRDALCAALAEAGIDYVFLGRELGARSEDPACYVDGKVDYERLAQTAPFHAGLARAAAEASTRRVALICAEKDPLTCHRMILVCRALADRGFAAQHIREDGRVESGGAALARLLDEVGLVDGDLFRDRDERIAEAYRRRGEQIAYSRAAD
jgi:uncharacterized protein (DUF488 family)